jgi:hypothetical protein
MRLKVTLATLLVVVEIAAAGGFLYAVLHSPAAVTNQNAPTSASLPSETKTVGPTATPGVPASVFNLPASADVHGLHIQTDGMFCGRYLVVAQPQETYNDATLTQMRSYVSSLLSSMPPDEIIKTPTLPGNLPPLPAALQWVTGTGVCLGALTITNTQTTPVQLTQFGVIFATDSVPNTYHYRLLDTCSLGIKCPQGGSSVCDAGITLNLAAGSAGNVITAPVGMCPLSSIGNPILSPQIIAPSQTIVLHIGFTSSPMTLSYRLHLSLGISRQAEGASSITLPASFDSTIVFSDAHQTSVDCYGLHGNTFTPYPDGVFDPSAQLCI